MAEFFLDLVPPRVTHQQKKVAVVGGKPRFYEPERLADARRRFLLFLAPYRPASPWEGPVRLCTRWQFPRGKRKAGWKTTRPDTDNLQKLLKDCMTQAGFWKDDAQVVSETAQKVWAQRAGIWIKAEEIEVFSP